MLSPGHKQTERVLCASQVQLAEIVDKSPRIIRFDEIGKKMFDDPPDKIQGQLLDRLSLPGALASFILCILNLMNKVTNSSYSRSKRRLLATTIIR